MPRRPSKAADTGKDGGDEPTTASYLDSFLNRAPARSPRRRQPRRLSRALHARGAVASSADQRACPHGLQPGYPGRTGITEENDLPGDLKNTLKQLRDLDTQVPALLPAAGCALRC
eukprot:scaffold24417_cov81-Isochrysis_galbana.AAC.1